MVQRRPNLWLTVALPVGLSALTVVGSIGGAYLGAGAAYRAQDVRMVEIALSILKGDSVDEKGRPARQFAIETLKRYSGLSSDQVDWDTWLARGTVPFDSVLSWADFIAKDDVLGQLLTQEPPSQ
jgi:hypothetical protein